MGDTIQPNVVHAQSTLLHRAEASTLVNAADSSSDRAVYIDFSRVSYISSSAIGCFLAAAQKLRVRHTVTLVVGTDAIKLLCSHTGLSTVYDVRDLRNGDLPADVIQIIKGGL